jgi:nucleoside-diphosphate-sugar epimerase
MITVLGASGFIGSNIINKLKLDSIEHYAPNRDDSLIGKNLGDIIYCIGLTADFRIKPFETVEAHICKLNYVLSKCTFNSLTYLSSTRVYINSLELEVNEESKILVDPLDYEDLYTLTKLTGERLCLSSGSNVKIARLSNVIGNDKNTSNFLFSIIDEIVQNGHLNLKQTINSAKDYIFIDDVVDLLLKISINGNQKVYNVASGKNISNAEILDKLRTNYKFTYAVNENAIEKIFPKISNEKICEEFNFIPLNITNSLINIYK